jgi:hypothetical protein
VPESPHPKHCFCFYCQEHHPENAPYQDTALGDALRLKQAIVDTAAAAIMGPIRARCGKTKRDK